MDIDDPEDGYWDEREYVRPWLIEPVHIVRDQAKFRLLRRRMRLSGWRGRPVLVECRGNLRAWTGSHRLAAAVEADLDEIPILRMEARDVTRANAALARNWETSRIAEIYREGFFDDWERLDWLEQAARIRPGLRSALGLMRTELGGRWDC